MLCTRMNGAGNSFIITDNICGTLSVEECRSLAKELCSEKYGRKTDGFMVVTAAADADIGMLFINSDGSVGEMCGNGARCLARYAYEHGFASDSEKISIRACAGIVTGRRINESTYEIRLNDPGVIRFLDNVNGHSCTYVELGNPGIPHAIVPVSEPVFDDIDALRELGRSMRYNPVFPKGANVTFAAVTGKNRVKAITFERGVEDFTLACGTGCGSTATAFAVSGLLCDGPLFISMPGGELSVRLKYDGKKVSDIYLTGPTELEGTFDYPI